MLLIGDSLARHAVRDPGRVALLFEDRAVSYGELDADANRVANALVGRGVRRGDFVSVLVRNCVEHVVLYFATARVGAILSPINTWMREPEILWTIAQVQPKAIVVAQEWIDAILGGATSIPDEHIVALEPRTDGRASWATLLAEGGEDAPARRPDELDPHIVFYTSGTTGSPKGVLKTQRSHVLNAMSYCLALGLDEHDRGLCAFPLFNVGGYESSLHKYLYIGGSCVLMPKFEAGAVLAAIERDRVTAALCNPTHFRLLLDHPDIATTDLSSLRLGYVGGMVLPERQMREIAEVFGIGMDKLIHIYGQSEGPPLISVLPGCDAERKVGSIGRAVPGVEMRIADDDGRHLGWGETGEIVIRADDVMAGYLNNPEATAEALRDGWLHTGDLAALDEDGYFFIVGRKKDLIRSGGQSVFPSDIETVLGEHPAVKEVAVIGTPDPEGVWGELVTAVIVARDPDARPDTTELSAYVRARVAGYKVPKRYEFLDELPRTETHKLAKARLREMFGSVFSS